MRHNLINYSLLGAKGGSLDPKDPPPESAPDFNIKIGPGDEAMVTNDGRFSYRQIFSYLSDGQYPPGFSKADKSVGFSK